MNRDSVRRRSIMPDPLPARGLCPNPGRSSASTRPSPASPGATRTQFTLVPPSPCTITNVVSAGPAHSR